MVRNITGDESLVPGRKVSKLTRGGETCIIDRSLDFSLGRIFQTAEIKQKIVSKERWSREREIQLKMFPVRQIRVIKSARRDKHSYAFAVKLLKKLIKNFVFNYLIERENTQCVASFAHIPALREKKNSIFLSAQSF